MSNLDGWTRILGDNRCIDMDKWQKLTRQEWISIRESIVQSIENDITELTRRNSYNLVGGIEVEEFDSHEGNAHCIRVKQKAM